MPKVLTVPMRNGNHRNALTYERMELCVLTVPMRNGNFDAVYCIEYKIVCSYRTYEEWKPKRITKEEARELVLTVPMRNGNRSSYEAKQATKEFLPYL